MANFSLRIGPLVLLYWC